MNIFKKLNVFGRWKKQTELDHLRNKSDERRETLAYLNHVKAQGSKQTAIVVLIAVIVAIIATFAYAKTHDFSLQETILHWSHQLFNMKPANFKQ